MLGVTIGALVPGRRRAASPCAGLAARTPSHRDQLPGPSLGEVARSSQALLAFFALSNVDVIVARNVLTARRPALRGRPDHDQGRALPAAVRRGGRLPRDVDPRQRGRTALVRGVLMVGRRRGRGRRRGLVALAARDDLRRRRRVLRDRVAAVAVRGARHPARDAPAPRVRRRWPGRAAARSTRRGPPLVLVVGLGLACDSLESLLAVVVAVDAVLLVVLAITRIGLGSSRQPRRRVY